MTRSSSWLEREINDRAGCPLGFNAPILAIALNRDLPQPVGFQFRLRDAHCRSNSVAQQRSFTLLSRDELQRMVAVVVRLGTKVESRDSYREIGGRRRRFQHVTDVIRIFLWQVLLQVGDR